MALDPHRKTLKFVEHEATFGADPESAVLEDTLAEDPFVLVQGYRIHPAPPPQYGEREQSVRYMGASRQAFVRDKTMSMTGSREKETTELALGQAMRMLERMPKVTVKFRWLYEQRAEGGSEGGSRQWMIDYIPSDNLWRAETEFKTPEAMQRFRSQPELWPEFVTEDLTEDERGYTRNQAQKLRPTELARWIEVSKVAGQKEKYAPKPESDAGTGRKSSGAATIKPEE